MTDLLNSIKTENEEEAVLLKSYKNDKTSKSVNSNNTENDKKNSENIQGKNNQRNAKSTYKLYKSCQEVTVKKSSNVFFGLNFFIVFDHTYTILFLSFFFSF